MFGRKNFVLALSLVALSPAPHAVAEPKSLFALNRADELLIKYKFAPGVKWCFDIFYIRLIPAAAQVTIDLDTASGTITFDAASVSQKIVCEPTGIRSIVKGVEEFNAFPG